MKYATRPYYSLSNTVSSRLLNINEIKFEYFSGFAEEQKKRSIESMHKAIEERHPGKKILEVSKASLEPLGQQLSAFRLALTLDNERGESITSSVERFFQGSKVFDNGGPFEEIIYDSRIHPKRYEKLKKSGDFKGFKLFGEPYSIKPNTYFYDWLYINALKQNKDLISELETYDIFTDIEFNHTKSFSCQAATIALFLGLKKADILEKVTKNSNEFLKFRLDVEPNLEIKLTHNCLNIDNEE